MLISLEQLRRRLAVVDVALGDIEVDIKGGYIELYGRAVNHRPARFNIFKPVSVEDIVSSATVFFYGQPQAEQPVEDGRKLGA